MIAILKFKLPDDKYEYDLAMAAGKMQSAIYEYSMYLRSIDKYSCVPQEWFNLLNKDIEEYHMEQSASLKNISKEDLETIMLFVVSKLRTKFYEELNSEGVSDIG